MPIRILHTADNHIGLRFTRYPEEVRDQLLEERHKALERLVAEANRRKAHFLVVAGDLFDHQNVLKKDVARAVKALAAFEGDQVLVLAGNHDYCEGPDNQLWKWFRDLSKDTCVVPMTESSRWNFECSEGRVSFYACPCPSKHGEDHRIGWVADVDKDPDALHIGIAHGNVEGLGLDADQRYFNMSEAQMKEAGVHTWLLGHIHVPAPAPGTTGRPVFYMPGIHAPDSVKCPHGGHAWWLELEPTGSFTHERLDTGKIRFVRISRELANQEDIDRLKAECDALDPAGTVLNLQLKGRLGTEERQLLEAGLEELKQKFLHLEDEVDIAAVLDAEAIGKAYPDGTLPHALLHALLKDDDHPEDASLAHDIIQSLDPS